MKLEHLTQLRRLRKQRKASLTLIQMKPSEIDWITGFNTGRRNWTPIGHWTLSEEDFNALKDSGALADVDIEIE